MGALRRISLALFLCLCVVLWPAQALAVDSQPTLKEATAAYLMDSSGRVLYEQNPDEEMAMASITKIMTAMVALDAGIPMDQPIDYIWVEFPDWAQTVGYTDADTPTFGELMRATLIFSGNDAALNVAFAVAGSNEAFADLMNQKAQEIGMTHTHFMNPHGLEEEGHYSCARDLVLMGRYAMKHYPFIRDTVHTPQVTVTVGGNTFTLNSTDDLMGVYSGLLGIKTGKTQAGTSFLGCAQRDDITLYSCVLCCETEEGRFTDTRTLLDWGFSLYEHQPLASSSRVLRTVPWQDGFWLRSSVAAQHDTKGAVFCEGEVTHTTVMQKPSLMVASGDVCGTTVWQQEGRHVGSVGYAASAPQARTKAWNSFLAPLFD